MTGVMVLLVKSAVLGRYKESSWNEKIIKEIWKIRKCHLLFLFLLFLRVKLIHSEGNYLEGLMGWYKVRRGLSWAHKKLRAFFILSLLVHFKWMTNSLGTISDQRNKVLLLTPQPAFFKDSYEPKLMFLFVNILFFIIQLCWPFFLALIQLFSSDYGYFEANLL